MNAPVPTRRDLRSALAAEIAAQGEALFQSGYQMARIAAPDAASYLTVAGGCAEAFRAIVLAALATGEKGDALSLALIQAMAAVQVTLTGPEERGEFLGRMGEAVRAYQSALIFEQAMATGGRSV